MLSAAGMALLALGASACARPSGDDTGATSQSLPSSHPIAGVDDESATEQQWEGMTRLIEAKALARAKR
jgi:hypothetical protein